MSRLGDDFEISEINLFLTRHGVGVYAEKVTELRRFRKPRVYYRLVHNCNAYAYGRTLLEAYRNGEKAMKKSLKDF